MQDPTETLTLNQLAGYTRPLMSPDAPARAHIVRRCLSDIKRGSHCEIQLQRADSLTDNSNCCHTNSAVLEQSQTAETSEPTNRNAGSNGAGSERGIELQEQGHAEMLEHALGKHLRPHPLKVVLMAS